MRKIKIVLIGVLSVLVIGLLGLMSWMIYSGSYFWSWGNDGPMKTYLKEEIRQEMDAIFVDVSQDYDVVLLQSEEDFARLEVKNTRTVKEEDRVSFRIENGKLRITQSQTIQFGMFVGSTRGRIELYLPREYYDRISDCEIHTTAGDIKFDKNVAFSNGRNFTLNAISGDIKVGQIQAEKLEIKTTSGDIKSKLAEGKYRIESISGDVKIDALIGKGSIKTVSGRIKADIEAMTGEVQVNSMSGDVLLKLSQDIQAWIHTQSVSGDIKIESDSIRNGEKLNIETTSGDIKVVSR